MAANAFSFGMMLPSHFLMNWSVFPSVIFPNSIASLHKEETSSEYILSQQCCYDYENFNNGKLGVEQYTYSYRTVLIPGFMVPPLWETYRTWHIQETWVFIEDFRHCRSCFWYLWSALGVCFLHCWFDWRNVLWRGPQSFHQGDSLTGLTSLTALPLVLLCSCSSV